MKRIFSRKGAKVQRKALETRQRFAPLRERFFSVELLFVQSQHRVQNFSGCGFRNRHTVLVKSRAATRWQYRNEGY
jgi:hypothetical protein